MGHYDSLRESYDEERQKERDREFLIEVLSGRYDCLIEASSLTKSHVTLNSDAFSHMLRLLKNLGRGDPKIAEIAQRRMAQQERYLLERLRRGSQKD